MEFRGQEEPAEGMGASAAPPLAPGAAPATPPAQAQAPGNHAAPPEVAVRYHECLRNHAAALGGHVVDGCGEFMPGAGAGDDALKCAACGCHRSFHRKDDGQRRQLLLPPPAPAPAPPPPPVTPTAPRVPLLLLPPHPYAAAAAAAGHPHYAPPFPYHGTPSGSGGTTTESSSEERGPPSAHAAAAAAAQGGHLRRKRFRTKFTPEQKEQMLAFAERLGWRMQKQDEALVQQFCEQVGVRRQVFKVWMHNNKHSGSGGRRQPQLPPQEQQSQQQPQQQQ